MRPTTRRWLLLTPAGLILLICVLSLIPLDRSNPAPHQVSTLPPAVNAVLARACYDCHSNRTRWPWYSYVAPVSFLIANHVHEGREKLNFSLWDTMTPQQQAHAAEESLEEIEKGRMPETGYTPMHPEARLTPQDLALLRTWAGTKQEDEDRHKEGNRERD